MSTINVVMEAIAGRLEAGLDPHLDGIQVDPRMVFNPTPPCLDIYPADPFLVQTAFGPGEREATFVIRARVSTADNEGGQELLLDLLDPAGNLSVIDVLAADSTLGGAVQDSAVPIGPSGFIVYAAEGGGGDLLGAEWRLQVIL